VTSITIGATASEVLASVNGAGSKTLSVGANTIIVTVIAEDGLATKTYTLIVTRAADTSVVDGGGSGSGSGGGGYSAPVDSNPPTAPVEPKTETPAADPVTAPAADNNAEVTYTSSNETAKVDLSTEKIDEIISKSGNEIADINLSQVSGIKEAELPATAIEQLAKNEVGLSVALPEGEVTLSSEAVAALSETAKGSDIVIKVENLVPAENLNSRQLEKVGNSPVYDISVMSGGEYIHDFGAGLITISIPYTLKPGEKASGIKVYYLDEDGNIQQMSAMYDAKTKCVIFTTDHLSTYYISYEEWVNTYPDITGEEWFYNYVEYVSENGIMGGTDLGFEPRKTLTRAQLVGILYNYVKPARGANTTSFTDVPLGQWYSDPIAWAASEGIVSGVGNDKFEPNRAITREEMMTVFYKFAKWQDKGPVGAWAIRLDYPDIDKVSSWASDAVMWVTMKGIMEGTPIDGVNYISPKGTATRAQAAVVITKYIEAIS
jgi:hypothetical protein